MADENKAKLRELCTLYLAAVNREEDAKYVLRIAEAERKKAEMPFADAIRDRSMKFVIAGRIWWTTATPGGGILVSETVTVIGDGNA